MIPGDGTIHGDGVNIAARLVIGLVGRHVALAATADYGTFDAVGVDAGQVHSWEIHLGTAINF